MKVARLMLVLSLVGTAIAQQAPAPAPPPQQPGASVEIGDLSRKLLSVRRIYVDSFGDDAAAKQLQAMVVASLLETKRFIITENKDKADAILRGFALEKTSQELHTFSEGASAGTAAGGHSGSIDGNWVNGTGSLSGSSSGGFAARSVAAEDQHADTETVNNARIAVRLVASDGDVIWATKQESNGAKYQGASADVADKVAKQLLRDIERAERGQSRPTP